MHKINFGTGFGAENNQNLSTFNYNKPNENVDQTGFGAQ